MVDVDQVVFGIEFFQNVGIDEVMGLGVVGCCYDQVVGLVGQLGYVWKVVEIDVIMFFVVVVGDFGIEGSGVVGDFFVDIVYVDDVYLFVCQLWLQGDGFVLVVVVGVVVQYWDIVQDGQQQVQCMVGYVVFVGIGIGGNFDVMCFGMGGVDVFKIGIQGVYQLQMW